MKGATTTTGSPRPCLPAERNAIIDVIAKTFDKPLVDVEEKMRGCLRRLRLMHKCLRWLRSIAVITGVPINDTLQSRRFRVFAKHCGQ
ncbi:hypothetical protein DPMN_002739 [Dreissena polymorpha]|uniref:Uncharacterized protein n=1 Tax=Dreissena polymorpha TaxID=45954 RepID=A0A9D4MMW7_DREPO|nr:hypothetical protein DPMN_002739 [Dreissena polymorpha]